MAKKVTKKKRLIGNKGKDVGGATRLGSGGFGKATEVAMPKKKLFKRKKKK